MQKAGSWEKRRKEGSHRGPSGTAKHLLGHSTLRFGSTGIFWGVTLHCMQASSFHDKGSDLGPLQWK